jgi:hypothetical protein
MNWCAPSKEFSAPRSTRTAKPRGQTGDQFPHARMAVAAFDDEVGADIRGARQDDVADADILCHGVTRLGFDLTPWRARCSAMSAAGRPPSPAIPRAGLIESTVTISARSSSGNAPLMFL